MRTPRRELGSRMFVLVGAVAFLLLHLQFVLWWDSYYSRFPFYGYRSAMAAHQVPPFFTSSERSLLVARFALAVLPLIALPFASITPWKAVRAMWGGVMLAVILIWISTPALRQDSNLWPIDLVFLAVTTGIPLVLGMFTYLLAVSVLRQSARGAR
jgi:hypothetical protein